MVVTTAVKVEFSEKVLSCEMRWITQNGTLRLKLNRTAAVAQLTFTKLQFVEDGSFTGGIKTNHKDSHLLLAELYCNERSINTTANT